MLYNVSMFIYVAGIRWPVVIVVVQLCPCFYFYSFQFFPSLRATFFNSSETGHAVWDGVLELFAGYLHGRGYVRIMESSLSTVNNG